MKWRAMFVRPHRMLVKYSRTQGIIWLGSEPLSRASQTLLATS